MTIRVYGYTGYTLLIGIISLKTNKLHVGVCSVCRNETFNYSDYIGRYCRCKTLKASFDQGSYKGGRNSLLHLLQQPCKVFEVARVDVDVKQVAVAVEELVGGPGVYVEVSLDGCLLL